MYISVDTDIPAASCRIPSALEWVIEMCEKPSRGIALVVGVWRFDQNRRFMLQKERKGKDKIRVMEAFFEWGTHVAKSVFMYREVSTARCE